MFCKEGNNKILGYLFCLGNVTNESINIKRYLKKSFLMIDAKMNTTFVAWNIQLYNNFQY